ncbi:hypothetical protein [Streptomyces fuscichromogenes]|uniref:Lipoprotein n=1 Tax=Streptomyces fuscichromogenes TaxID=1324013 RepID=A0A917XA61_9ACTN|nr:hypothetical protein [Streptomyces fuscichromogenes]GGN00117.1 hypothetical protein GCM10011578_021680 [Streptomyces fuscichromogenes]
MRSPWTWAALAAVTGACAALPFLAAGGDGPRPLSAAEARRVALTPLRTYRDSPAEVTVRAPLPGGTAVVRAVVDERRQRAVGWFDTGDAAERGLLAWDGTGLAVARPRTDGSAGPLARPASTAEAVRDAARLRPTAWIRRRYGPASLDTALRLTLALAADRPDDARRIARSGRRHLGTDRIDGRRYDVFSAADSPLRYWIDAAGRLRRVREDLDDDRTIEVDVTGVRVRPGVPEAPWAKG